MGDVVKLELIEVGEGFRLDAQPILDGAGEQAFERMAIVGRLEDGRLYVAGTANAGETLVLLKQAEHFICFGKDDAE